MRKRLALLVVASSIATVGPAAVGSPTALACSKATIGGQSKCIARGQYCARAHASDYRKYGLSCTKVDVRGRYHLQ